MKTKSFETELKELNAINDKLEGGNVGLQDSLKLFKKGKLCGNTINKILDNSKTSFAKIETSDGTEKPYSRDKNGKDINNTASIAPSTPSKSTKSSSDSKSKESAKPAESKTSQVSKLSLFSHTSTSNSTNDSKSKSLNSNSNSSSNELSDDDLPF